MAIMMKDSRSSISPKSSGASDAGWSTASGGRSLRSGIRGSFRRSSKKQKLKESLMREQLLRDELETLLAPCQECQALTADLRKSKKDARIFANQQSEQITSLLKALGTAREDQVATLNQSRTLTQISSLALVVAAALPWTNGVSSCCSIDNDVPAIMISFVCLIVAAFLSVQSGNDQLSTIPTTKFNDLLIKNQHFLEQVTREETALPEEKSGTDDEDVAGDIDTAVFTFDGKEEIVKVGDGNDEPLDKRLARVADFSFESTPEELDLVRELDQAIKQEPDTPEMAYLKSMKLWEKVRFLRGNITIKETMIKLKDTSKMRYTQDVKDLRRRFYYECEGPNILAEDKSSPEFLRGYYPSRLLGMSGNRPISLYRMILADFPGLIKQSGTEAVTQFQIWQMHMAWDLFPQGDGILIMDLGHDKKEDNLPISSLWEVRGYVSALLDVVKTVAQVADPAFPESFASIYFVRPPGIFWASWKIAKFFVSERTRTKINVLGSNEKSWAPLYASVPKELLPKYLGGTNELAGFPAGGRISKLGK